MKVILLDNIKGVGKKDEVINASDGYARNYLFPKKLAVEANNENMLKLKARQNGIEYKKSVEKEEATKLANKLKELKLQIKVKAGENGKIFGGVTAKEISENLKTQYNIQIDKKKIYLPETIETIDLAPIEAAESVGATKLQVAVWAIWPQIMLNVLSYFFYAFELNVRASVVLGYVGAGGIGVTLSNALGLFRYDRASLIIITIFVVVLTIDYLSEQVRRRLE